MAESKEPTSVFIETTDAIGKPITVFSTDGKLRTTAEFATAIDNYDNGQKPTPGFLTLPSNTFQGKMRTGFENSVGGFAREQLPRISEAVGGVATISPLLLLLQKAGLVKPEVQQGAINIGRDTGRAVGRFAGEQFDTPGEAGMALATGGMSKYLKAPTSAAGSLLKIPLIANILKSGAAGFAGTTAARAATGEGFDPGQGIIDFAVPAVGGTMQGIVSHFLTKYLNQGLPEKVAKGIMDTFKERHPNMSFGDNVLDIASSSQHEIASLTQQMGKGLRESVEVTEKGLIDQLNATLPSSLSVGQQNIARGGIRRLLTAQNEHLDNIANPELFEKTSLLIKQRTQDLINEVKGFFPKVKNIGPLELRVEGVLQGFNKQAESFNEAAQVLHYLRQSGAAEGFDFNKFAQLIKGVYNENPGSQLAQVGRILSPDRPLTAMPTQQTQQSPSSGMKAAVDYMYNKLGPVGKALTLKDTGPSFPWPPKQAPLQPLINFGAQESGQVPSQAVLRSFVNQGEQK
jgi:hypothetical protein